MIQSNHTKQLHQKHQELEQKIESANKHPAFDDLEITKLKKEKLKLKEEIERIKQQAA